MSNSSFGQANLIENLRPLVDSGQIVIHDDDTPWVDLIRTRFPLHTTGICWEQIPSTQSRSAEQPRRPIADKAEEIKEFLREYAAAAGLGPDDKCIVLSAPRKVMHARHGRCSVLWHEALRHTC